MTKYKKYHQTNLAYSRQYQRTHRPLIRKINSRSYYRNRVRTLAKMKEMYAAERAWFNELKNAPCLDCRHRYPACVMEFDHIRGVKKFTIGTMLGHEYKRERILKEIAKCELVCANCHRIRTYLSDRPIKGNTRRLLPGAKDEE